MGAADALAKGAGVAAVIAKRVMLMWMAICDVCGAEGVAAHRRQGQTRRQRHDAFIWAGSGFAPLKPRMRARLDDFIPKVDGKWTCPRCKDGEGRTP